jgi:hypothetical protein
MLHVVESRKPLDRVVKDLEAAVARHKFSVLGVLSQGQDGRRKRGFRPRVSDLRGLQPAPGLPSVADCVRR